MRKERDPSVRMLRRAFRRHSLAFCKANNRTWSNQPRDGVLMAACLELLGLTAKRTKAETKRLILEALAGFTYDLPEQKKRIAKVDPKSFYEGREWRELRYKALKKNDGRCECCGAGKHDGAVLHVDHILPRSIFPSKELDLSNLQVLCADCNLGKSNKDMTDWRAVA